MFKKVLPLGSIVKVKGTEKKAMIIGFKQILAKEPSKIYDYVGVSYPYGSMGANTQFLFNEDKIDEVVYMGYEDEEWAKMINTLQEKYEEDPAFAAKMNGSK